MATVVIYMNRDERRPLQLSAMSTVRLVDIIEKRIRKLTVNAFDGATLGRPLEGHAHVTIRYVEGAPSNYCWEIEDNRNPYWHLRQHPDEYVECLPMEEAFHKFVTLCIEFANYANRWPTSVWS